MPQVDYHSSEFISQESFLNTLSELNPATLWSIFAELCHIPRPSKHEQAVAQWIMDWAKNYPITCEQDDTGNLLLSKPATAGMEDRPGVILQGHIDMVPQKNSDKVHDFTKDPIEAYVDGEWVTANGTTLGADNGIGVSSALAVLAADDIAHGPLEVLLTVDEEAGMNGAFGVQPNWLKGSLLINTDSEQEGEVYMGCAGGVDAVLSLPVNQQSLAADQSVLEISVRGLKGGHSGVDIHLERGNANKILARLLHNITLPWQLVAFDGGSLRNALPREATACIAVPNSSVADITAQLQSAMPFIETQYHNVEDNISLGITASTASQALTPESTSKALALLLALPHGVHRMSQTVAGIPETSSNMGVANIADRELTVQCLIRSLNDTGRDELAAIHQSLAELAGAKCVLQGAYPGWQPDNDSPLMHLVRETYQTLFNKMPNIMVIHAGLECGLFKTAYPHWDMVSFGPTIRFPHSPDEKVEIASVEHYWKLLVTVLAAIPAA